MIIEIRFLLKYKQSPWCIEMLYAFVCLIVFLLNLYIMGVTNESYNTEPDMPVHINNLNRC